MADGDSQLAGLHNYPNGFNAASQVARGMERFADFHNFALGGQTFVSMEADAASQIDPLYSDDYDINVIVAFAGGNDIAGMTLTAARAAIQTYCANRRAAGWKVIVATIMSRTASGLPADYETLRQSQNTWLRDNWASFADGFFDVGGDPFLGVAGAQTNRVYFKDDTIHLNNHGAARCAALIRGALASVGVPIQEGPALQLFIPAGDLRPLVGSPALTAHGITMTMDFDKDVQERAWGSFQAPYNPDARWNVDLVWRSTAVTGSAQFSFNVAHFDLGSMTDLGTGNVGVATAAVAATAPAATVAETVIRTRLGTVPLAGGMITTFQLVRVAADAADTLNADAQVMGIFLTAATPFDV